MSPLRSAVLLLRATVLVTAALLACDSSDRTTHATLETIPEPNIVGAEPPVLEQLTQERRNLETKLATQELGKPELAQAFGRMGLLYHAYDLLEPAEACYRNARLLEPKDPDWAYLLGLVLQRRGRLDESALELKAALALKPEDAPTLLHLGQVEHARNRLSQAQTRFQEALEADPQCHAARFGQGEVARSSGDLAGAAERFSAVLRDQPTALQVHYPLSQVLIRLGREDEAIPHLTRASERSLSVGGRPDCRDPLGLDLAQLRTGSAAAIRHGLQARLAGEAGQELDLLRRAVKTAPNDPQAHQRLARLHFQRNELATARTHFAEAVRLTPGNPELQGGLGSVLLRLERYSEAERHFRLALDVRPNSIHHRLQLALTLQRQERYQEAIAAYTVVLESEPTHKRALLQRGMSFAQLNRPREAGRDMGLLLDLHPPEDPAQHLRLASMLLSLGEDDRALDQFNTIVDSSAESSIKAQAHLLIGQVRMRRGDTVGAQESLQRAVELDPRIAQAPRGPGSPTPR